MLQHKKKIALTAAFITGMGTSFVQANPTRSSPHEFSIGLISNYYQYHEKCQGMPFMNFKGYMIGGSFTYLYTTQGQYVFGTDVDFSVGSADYESNGTGTMDNVKQLKFEGRLKGGKNFHYANGLVLTPYTGFGVRIKSDYTGNKHSTTGHVGYDRQSTYLYIPVGVKLKKQFNADWAFETFGEFDIFLQGKHYSDTYPSTNHTQKKGYGLKTGFESIRSLCKKQSISFGPYVSFWHIKDSNIVDQSMEPNNKTLEVGLGLRYRF